jgi:hypothetical protein
MDGCSVDAAPVHIITLGLIPCKDVSCEGDDWDAIMRWVPPWDATRWSSFQKFLDSWERATKDAPLEMVTSTYPDFFPFCGYMPNCGNTCCVPSGVGTNETAPAAAGD